MKKKTQIFSNYYKPQPTKGKNRPSTMYLTKEILQHTYFSFFEKKTRMHRFLRKAPAATDYFITFPIPFIAQGEGERAGLGHGVRAPGHKGSTGRWAAMTGWIDPAGTQNPCLVSRCHARE